MSVLRVAGEKQEQVRRFYQKNSKIIIHFHVGLKGAQGHRSKSKFNFEAPPAEQDSGSGTAEVPIVSEPSLPNSKKRGVSDISEGTAGEGKENADVKGKKKKTD